MKPNFALSLTFDGIRLLHRAAGGWRIVGDVALDAPDMAAELSVLRRTATALVPGGLRTKVLLPKEQVKFLTIDTSDMDDAARMQAARDALDDATPYRVDDLAFDISADGDNTHVAAVARETLAEAEAFAIEHRFCPMSFATVPGDTPYLGEPFFGPSRSASALLEPGDHVEPDGIAVVVIGDVGSSAQNAPVVAPDEPKVAQEQEEVAAEEPLEETILDADAETEETEQKDEAVEPVAEDDPKEAPSEPVATAEIEEAEPQGEAIEVSAKDDAGETVTEPVAAAETDETEQQDEAVEEQAKGDAEETAAEPVAATKIEETERQDEAVEEQAKDGTEDTSPDPVITAKPETGVSDETQEAASDETLTTPKDTPEAQEADTVEKPDVSEPTADKPAPLVQAAPSDPEKAATDTTPSTPLAPEKNPPTPLPVLPSLGGASRAAPTAAATPVAPAPPKSGFLSKRNAEPAPPRREAVVTAPTLPVETGPDTQEAPTISASSVPPASSAPDELPQPDNRSLTPDPVVAPAAPKVGFLSRRKKKAAAASAALAPAANTPVPNSEEERMTIFGARSRDVGGKPRFLGLILTAVLLVFLAGVAAWASVFLDDGLSLSRLFGDRAPREIAQAPDPEPATPAPAEIETASLSPALTEEDTAVLDALSEPVLPSVATPGELEAGYALTGIWPVAPQVPPEPAGLINIDDFYVPSIDPISTASDAVALPDMASLATDVALANVSAPAAAGTTFALDDRGLVIPTAQGALSPDGFTVYMGRPDLVPPATPTRFQAVPQADTANRALAAFRPKNRPEDLSETNERANLDGLTRSELAGYRPRFRPKSVQQQAAEAQAIAAAEAAAATAAAEAAAAAQETAQTPQPEQTTTPETAPASNNYVNPTRLAIQTSVRPDTRPRNFARIVRRAQRTPQPQAETRNASATVAPRVVTPKIPSSASVARQATVRNAINLRQVNLIGVYGKPSNRRALVRLANGRYKKVVVGDRIDGGRVSAIGDSELRYQKRGRSVVLKMPRG